MNIADRIRTLRTLRGITQRALADALNVSQPYISEVENYGERSASMSVAQVEAFALGLGVPTIALIEPAQFEQAVELAQAIQAAAAARAGANA